MDCGALIAHGSAYRATTIVTPHPKPNKDADFNWPLSRRMPSSQRVAATFISCMPTVMPASGVTRAVLQPRGRPAGASGRQDEHLQAVAPIPAFKAWSMLWLQRRNDAAVVAFEGIGFAF